jgi:ribonuclease inhibitor
MRTALLDANLADRAAICARLAAALEFPPHAATNLDALWDVLRTDIPGPFAIIWRDHAAARIALGAEYDRLVALFADLAAERDDVSFTLA